MTNIGFHWFPVFIYNSLCSHQIIFDRDKYPIKCDAFRMHSREDWCQRTPAIKFNWKVSNSIYRKTHREHVVAWSMLYNVNITKYARCLIDRVNFTVHIWRGKFHFCLCSIGECYKIIHVSNFVIPLC